MSPLTYNKVIYLFGKPRSVVIRAGQKVRFLPNIFLGVSHNFFSLFRSKALQKTKNWKFLWIFSPGKCPSKFYYITIVCKMGLGRKFKFFPIFHYKTMLFSFESEFSVKNVIFWGTSCWCSSKIKKYGGVLISYNCSLWAPRQLLKFLSYINMMYLKRSHFS